MTASTRTIRAIVLRAVAGGVLAVGLSGTLVGCSGTPIDNMIGGAVDGALERALEEARDAGIDVSTDGGIPEGFPTDAVPLIEGTVVGGGSGGGIGWVVVVNADSMDRFADAQSALEQAGYAANVSNADDKSAFGSFAGADYNVQLTFSTDTDGVVSATYVVTPA